MLWVAYTTTVCFRLDWTDTFTRCLRFPSLFLNSVTWSTVSQIFLTWKVFWLRSENFLLVPLHLCLCSFLLLPTATHLPPSAAPLSSLMQLSSMSENEDVLLEFFVSLPQLKQITNDKEELVTSIVDMASKLLFDTWSEGFDGYNYEREVRIKLSFPDICAPVCHLQRKTFRWSHSSKEKDKKCSTRSYITSHILCSLIVSLPWTLKNTFMLLHLAASDVFDVCWQYEQLTQMKSAFETRMQRQHDLSEVRGSLYCSFIDNRVWVRMHFCGFKPPVYCPWFHFYFYHLDDLEQYIWVVPFSLP